MAEWHEMSTHTPQEDQVGSAPDADRVEAARTFGVSLPTFPQHGPVDFAQILASARLAEHLGFSHAWLWDHIAWHAPCAESITTAAAVLAATERLNVGLGVLQIPLRQPAILAAQLATLSDIGGPRFTFGVGYGQRVDEFIELGVDFETRWGAGNRALAETLRRFDTLRPGRRLRVIKGGRSVAMVRASARLDGWMGLFLSPDGLASRLHQANPAPNWVSMQLFVGPPGQRSKSLKWISTLYGLPPERFAHHVLPEDPAAQRAVVRRYQEAGVHHVSFAIAADDPTETLHHLAASLMGNAEGGFDNGV